MIYEIYANDKRFKRIKFDKGLNVIVADSEQESDDKDTRNGVGKTTLINIIHFCLGSRLKKNRLPIDKINDWIFNIDLDVCGEKLTASRSIDNNRIVKIEGNTDNFPIPPQLDQEDNFLFYPNEDWKKLLGMCLFDIKESGSTRYNPSFRSLISYFVRRDIGGYNIPFMNASGQQTVDWKLHTAFLLGLNWLRISESQELVDKEKTLKNLAVAEKEGFISTSGKLEAERIRLEKVVKLEKKALSTFEVHPQYKEIEENANKLTRKIHDLANQKIIFHHKLENYEESVSSESSPDSVMVEDLYEEAGMIFSDTIKKTLKDAQEFHETIIRNRKEFLQTEIAEIKNQIDTVERDLINKTKERAVLLDVLKKYGALEEYSILQERCSEKKEKLDYIKLKIEESKDRDIQLKKIKEEKLILETKFNTDYEESRPIWEKEIALFNENSIALYNQPGYLVIDPPTEKGYKIKVEIPRSESEGISKMKIFCYDLMLVNMFSQREKINFLIHDSIIYDSVDSRQRAHALQYAHYKGVNNGFQYICALNSDMIPYDHFKNDFNFEEFVRLTLTDRDPSGSLLGFEF